MISFCNHNTTSVPFCQSGPETGKISCRSCLSCLILMLMEWIRFYRFLSDRIFRIYWIFLIITFRKKVLKFNRLRRKNGLHIFRAAQLRFINFSGKNLYGVPSFRQLLRQRLAGVDVPVDQVDPAGLFGHPRHPVEQALLIGVG